MKESYPGQFENFPNEKNVFYVAERTYSPEHQSAFNNILKIVQRIIKDTMNIDQKRILMLFLNDHSLFDISQLLQVNNSTIHQNYNLVIKKISIALINDPEFMTAIETAPEYLGNKLIKWIDEVKQKYNLIKYICPICDQVFESKFLLKRHVIRQDDGPHKRYYKKQIKFIKKQLRKHGFAVAWIYEHENELLFSMSWIWNYWQKHYARKPKKNIFAIFTKKG